MSFRDHDWRRRPPLPLEDELDDEPIVVRYEVDGGKAIDAYIEDLAGRGRAPRTLRQYRTTLNRFLDTLPIDVERDLEMVTTADCRRFVEGDGQTPNTRRYVRAVLSSFFRWLHANGKIPTNPVACVSLPTTGVTVRPPDSAVIENERARNLSWEAR